MPNPTITFPRNSVISTPSHRAKSIYFGYHNTGTNSSVSSKANGCSGKQFKNASTPQNPTLKPSPVTHATVPLPNFCSHTFPPSVAELENQRKFTQHTIFLHTTNVSQTLNYPKDKLDTLPLFWVFTISRSSHRYDFPVHLRAHLRT